MPDPLDLIRRLTLALDCCLDHLDRQAALERHREAGKTLRAVTAQKRAEAAREAVKEGFSLLGMDADHG